MNNHERFVPNSEWADLDKLNERLDKMSIAQRISTVAQMFPPERRLASTSGGKDAWVLQHILRTTLGDSAPTIIFVDTDMYDPQTLENIEEMRAAGYPIEIYRPELSRDEIEATYPGWNQDRDSGQYAKVARLVKHEPMSRALIDHQTQLWFRRVLRVDSEVRATAPILRYVNGVYQFSPIVDVTRDWVDAYKQQYQLPSIKGHFDIFKGESPQDQQRECGIGEQSGVLLPLISELTEVPGLITLATSSSGNDNE